MNLDARFHVKMPTSSPDTPVSSVLTSCRFPTLSCIHHHLRLYFPIYADEVIFSPAHLTSHIDFPHVTFNGPCITQYPITSCYSRMIRGTHGILLTNLRTATGSVVLVSVTRGQSRHVTEVTSTDLTKSKVMMRVIPFLETVFKQ